MQPPEGPPTRSESHYSSRLSKSGQSSVNSALKNLNFNFDEKKKKKDVSYADRNKAKQKQCVLNLVDVRGDDDPQKVKSSAHIIDEELHKRLFESDQEDDLDLDKDMVHAYGNDLI